MNTIRRFWPIATALACLAAGWLLHRPGLAPVRYARVVVTDTLIMAGEPRVETRFVDRIIYRTVQPEQVATAPQAAVTDVARFCAPSVRTATADTTESPPPALLLRSGSFDGSDLEQWGPLSNGDLWRGSYRVHAPLTWRVDGDSLIVRGKRTWWVRPAAKGAVLIGIGALIGAVAH